MEESKEVRIDVKSQQGEKFTKYQVLMFVLSILQICVSTVIAIGVWTNASNTRDILKTHLL